MGELQVAHTSEFDPAALAAARALLYDVFDDMTEQDWEHSLGGMHVLAWEDGDLVGHAAVIQRRLLHGGRALRAGYVEGVGVRARFRRRGHGSAMLGATDEAAAWYAGRGWQLWQGRCSALTPAGIVATPEDEDCVYVLPVRVPLDLTGELTCDWRDGDVW
jgi:aminoglycoside 2'-N-acetyltransferase I